MPLDIHRLRNWIVIAMLALTAIVSGFYFYGRYRVRQAIRSVPQKLGVDVQQSAEGFSLSKSEGGRTLFTIRASKAIQNKTGRAELHEVNIVVYGREGNRFDQIYGSDFEYDPKTGNVTAAGQVHIDLQGVAEGNVRPDQGPPQELKNPIHLKTSGLIFNRNTGIATTDQVLEFRIPLVSGYAKGATYDSKANQLRLHSEIKLDSTGPNAASLSAKQGEINKDPPRVELVDAHIVRPSGVIDADKLTVYLRPDNTVERLIALGDITAEMKGKAESRAQAQRGEVLVDAQNHIRSAVLSGGVNVSNAGDQPMHGTAGRVVLDFGRDNQVEKVHALEKVRMVEEASAKKPQSQSVVLTSSSVDFLVNGDSGLERAESNGATQIEIISPAAKGSPSNTIATASRFIANFSRKGRLSSVVGSPNAKVVSSTPGQPDKITTSNVLTLTMNPTGELASIVQEGDFRYTEAAAKPGMRGTDATAQKAAYTPAAETFILTGSPRISDGGASTSADSMRVNRRTGEAVAEGSVKTTYSQIQPRPDGALLATGEPIHVTAANMTAHRISDNARYTGGARLWQGANIVQAPSLDFDRGNRTVTAQGKSSEPVSTVFVQQSQNGKQVPVSVTGLRLTYVDAQRQARFEGGVVMHSADGTVSADKLTVYLQPHGQLTSAASKDASQLEKVVAEGHVIIQQEGRRGTGDQLTYLARDASFSLTGGSPSIFDAEHGEVTGDSLTFFSHDDRVLVEGRKSAPSVTKARVIK